MDRYYRLWAEVDLDAIITNIKNIQKNLTKGTKTCAVIKADGYGHGAVKLAETIDDIVDFYAVATLDEAMELRGNGIKKPILILGYVDTAMADVAAEHDIRLSVYSLSMAEQISEAAISTGKKAKVHIKVDTGMSRIGFTPSEDSINIVKKIYNLPGIEIEGVFTHFANSDDVNEEKALKQFEYYKWFADRLAEEGMDIPVKHCANSAAATYIRETDMDMVRLGISMYGLYPSCYIHQVELMPALSLKSHVVMVKTIPAGTAVGYGSTWTANEERIIATIPVGYADGYLRSLSNKGYVLINGAKFPIVGRVCMDQLMVDVTEAMEGPEDVKVSEGDVVVLIGKSGDLTISCEEIADLAGSFNYEFVCGLSRRVPLKYYKNGEFAGVKDEFASYYH